MSSAFLEPVSCYRLRILKVAYRWSLSWPAVIRLERARCKKSQGRNSNNVHLFTKSYLAVHFIGNSIPCKTNNLWKLVPIPGAVADMTYVNPSSCEGIGALFIILGTLAVGARLYTRRLVGTQPFGVDDWLCLPALVFLWACCITTIVGMSFQYSLLDAVD